MSQHEFQKSSLLARKMPVDRRPCTSRAFFARERRQSVGDISKHIEDVALLRIDDLLHFRKLIVPKALLSQPLQQFLPSIRDAPEITQLPFVLKELRQFS